MTYYSNCCKAGSTNYSVSTPSVHYSVGDNMVSYSTTVSDPAMYQSSGNYALEVPNKSVPGIPYNSEKAIIPVKKAEIIMPSQDIERGFAKPIDRLIEDFLPKSHSNPAIDEIERAIGNVIKMEQFEIQEEIIIRRKIVKKSATFEQKNQRANSFLE